MTKAEIKEYWFKHFSEFQNYKGTKSSYAKLHQLKQKVFYSWCKKFELQSMACINSSKDKDSVTESIAPLNITSKVKKSDPGFIEVNFSKSNLCVNKLKISFSGLTIEMNELPSCDWLAELGRKVG